MAIKAVVDGNILIQPVQRVVHVKNEPVRITEFRLMSDVWRREDEKLVQDAEKTKPVAVTVWNERLGEQIFKTLNKGMRVEVTGDLHLHTWKTKDGEDGVELRITADDVKLKLHRIESITMREPKAHAEAATAAPMPTPDEQTSDSGVQA